MGPRHEVHCLRRVARLHNHLPGQRQAGAARRHQGREPAGHLLLDALHVELKDQVDQLDARGR